MTRIPVFQYGRQIGTMPASFDPRFARSKSFMYDIRTGDFTRTNEGWVVARNMGASDVDCVIGFVRDSVESVRPRPVPEKRLEEPQIKR